MSKNRLLYVVVLAALAVTASACSGDSNPVAPTPPVPDPTPSSTSITIQMFGGAPAVGATVSSEGKSAITDGSGTATFETGLRPGAPLDVDGTGFLAHKCTYGGVAVHTHQLIPVNGEFPKKLLHWAMFGGEYGQAICRDMLCRMDAPGSVVLEERLRGNPSAVAAVERDARLNTNLHATIPFYTRDTAGNLLTQARPGTVPVNVVVGPVRNGGCHTEFTSISGGRILAVRVQCQTEELIAFHGQYVSSVAHELGHAFGLGHFPDIEVGVMGGVGLVTDFTPLERRVVEFMLSRPPGTRWEDTLPGR